MSIAKGRYSAAYDDPFVVFLIGMRFNRVWAVHRWWKPWWATMRNLRKVEGNDRPEGYLGGEVMIYWRGLAMVQYWDSFDSLEAYSKNPDAPHLEAWRHLAKQSKHDHTFGYWHETYEVQPGKFECIYGNMPRFGFGKAADHLSVTEAKEHARARLVDADD